MKVVTEQQMREIDRVAIHERGIPSLDLMENAGAAVAEVILEDGPICVAVCAGKGNNAGDGFVIARHLHEAGVDVSLFLTAEPDTLKGDAKINFDRLPEGVKITVDPDAEALRSSGGEADIVVDAVLGTGISGEVRGAAAAMIDAINDLAADDEWGVWVVSVDIPSGLSAENLAADGPCVQADVTVTMGLPKVPMVTHPGAAQVGELIVADIGFPDDLTTSPEFNINMVDAPDLLDLLPERPDDSHKGTYGHLLIIAGSAGMGGAAALATQAAMRSGTGLVTLATQAEVLANVESTILSAVKRPLSSNVPGALDLTAIDQIGDALNEYNTIALGPGMGERPETKALVLSLIEKIKVPLVIDADGLNALTGNVSCLKNRKAPTVLTPHPKEMSRLTGLGVGEIQADRIGVAQRFAKEHGVTLLLKGSRTVIADPDGEVWIIGTGNTGLAKGGSGDVLTGLIAGLAAQGLSMGEAAVAGALWHGWVAEVIAQHVPERTIIPEDLINWLGESLGEISPEGVEDHGRG